MAGSTAGLWTATNIERASQSGCPHFLCSRFLLTQKRLLEARRSVRVVTSDRSREGCTAYQPVLICEMLESGISFRSVRIAFRSVRIAFRSVRIAFRSVRIAFRSVRIALRSVLIAFRSVRIASYVFVIQKRLVRGSSASPDTRLSEGPELSGPAAVTHGSPP
jgi:hypothetical protein